MIPSLLWICLFGLIASIQSRIIVTHQESVNLLSNLEPQMNHFVKRMAKNFSEEASRVEKARFLGKRSLRHELERYITETYARPTIKSFAPTLHEALQSGANEFEDKVWKRSQEQGSDLSPSQIRKEARIQALISSRAIQSKFQAHSQSKLNVWMRSHHLSSDKASILEKDDTPEPRASRSTDVSLSKRFLKQTKKNEAIFQIVRQFITVPITFSAMSFTGGGTLYVILWDLFYAGPILHKLVFGTFQ